MEKSTNERKKIVILLVSVVGVLLTLAIIQQTVNLSSYLEAPESQTAIILWALSSLNVVLLVICSLVLLRNLIKLYMERKSQELGSKFRTKLVFAFLGMIFIPILFMSFFSVFMLNRNIDKWFSAPIDQMLGNLDQQVKLRRQAAQQTVMADVEVLEKYGFLVDFLLSPSEEKKRELNLQLQGIQPLFLAIIAPSGQPLLIYDGAQLRTRQDPSLSGQFLKNLSLWSKGRIATANGGINGWDSSNPAKIFRENMTSDMEDVLWGTTPLSSQLLPKHWILMAEKVPEDVLRLGSQMAQSRRYYQGLAAHRKFIRNNYLLWLGLITLLILFAAVWIGLYLSRRITNPIKALIEAAEQVSQGNLMFQIDCIAGDELGNLIAIFNRMTVQLHENSRQLEQTNLELKTYSRAIEEKSLYTEAVLENIPTGVISIAPDYSISKMNRVAQRLLGPWRAGPLRNYFSPADLEVIMGLIEKAARLGYAAREMPLRTKERTLFCAITVSSLDLNLTPESELGFVMVLEDLTEVLKAQKASAWREVARRMAHEIKNPLTPIQLSAERLARNHQQLKEDPLGNAAERQDAFGRVVEESVQTITREVETLKRMVDEFSRFARMPSASLVYCNVNEVIENTLTVYNGRFEEVKLNKSLTASLPEVQLDPEQIKRLFVNLFDNALEAMEHSSIRELSVSTEYLPRKETIQIQVRDTGHGIDPADKEKLFLPYFSTRKRGTGLGLAIVNRIVSDHKGYIHVEDNRPQGTCFVIEIPARA
jgi:two-component system nitrogen regulation sensor histidine kinase NtrY